MDAISTIIDTLSVGRDSKNDGGRKVKAILVIDMPKECWDCPMHVEGLDDENEEIMVCNAEKIESHYGEKPSWCPLMPMPMKRETQVHWKSIGGGDIPTHEISDYDKGWNDCIDFLEGDMQDD